MVSCLMGDSTALASAIVRCCLNISAQSTVFAGVAVGIIFLFFGFYKTETGIKNKFLDDKF